MMARAWFVVAAAAAFGGCAGRPAQPGPAVELRAGPAAPPEALGAEGGEILLWGHIGEAPPRTYRLAADESGRVIADEPGIVIATSRGEWRWETREEKVKTEPCDFGNGPEGEVGEGVVTHASLRLRGGVDRQDVIVPQDPDGVNDIQHGVQVLGSVGPYLFLQEGMYMYACGAHGGSNAKFIAWDAERGKAVEMLAEMPDIEALKERAEKSLDEGDEDPDAHREDNPTELVQLVPKFDKLGRLSIDAQFSRWACYACSDGLWSSYTRSALVTSGKAPERLSPYTTPPPGVAVFLGQHHDIVMGGFSRRP
jgi:hypothetical protein